MFMQYKIIALFLAPIFIVTTWFWINTKINSEITDYKEQINNIENQDQSLIALAKQDVPDYSWIIDCAHKNKLLLEGVKYDTANNGAEFNFKGSFREFTGFCSCIENSSYQGRLQKCTIALKANNLLNILCYFSL